MGCLVDALILPLNADQFLSRLLRLFLAFNT